METTRNIYVCPESKEILKCVPDRVVGSEIVSGRFVNDGGDECAIEDGIPDLTFPKTVEGEQKETRDYYAGVAGVYEAVAQRTFRTLRVEEMAERRKVV